MGSPFFSVKFSGSNVSKHIKRYQNKEQRIERIDAHKIKGLSKIINVFKILQNPLKTYFKTAAFNHSAIPPHS